jgi:hypothetical protein
MSRHRLSAGPVMRLKGHKAPEQQADRQPAPVLDIDLEKNRSPRKALEQLQ